jgi:recombination associated protein RdgC
MQVMEKARSYEFLGREFLVWLWFRSRTNEGRFPLGEAGEAQVWFDGRVVLQSEKDGDAEKVICMGEKCHMREGRFALAEYKTITEAVLRLIMGEDEWTFSLDSQWMNFKSFKTPFVAQNPQEDPDGLFYEKLGLIEKAISAMDAIYSSFIQLRVSPEWQAEELPALLDWIRAGNEHSPRSRAVSR